MIIFQKFLSVRAFVQPAPLVLLFDNILTYVALERCELRLPPGKPFVVVVLNNRLVLNEVVFIPHVDSTCLLILGNLP